MGRQTWIETLITAEGDGTALANSTTPTSILPTASVFTLPANFFDIGRKIRIKAYGKISTTGTPTIIFTIYLAGSVWCASQTITTGSGLSNVTWDLEMEATCRAIGNGTSANAMFEGKLFGVNSATGLVMIPATTPAVSSGFNSVVSNTVDLFATWGSANSLNTITLNGYSLESCN